MPLPIENFIFLVSSIVPFCHQISLLATLYCCLSDRKAFSENPFVSPFRLYRHLCYISPFALRLFSSLSTLILLSLSKTFPLCPIISVDTTFLRRNGMKLPFLKKSYDPLQKRGAIGQVLAIACFHLGKLCIPLGFLIVEGSRREGVLSLLSCLSFLPDRLTLLVDGGLMSKRLVDWVRENRKGWRLIGEIRRNKIVSCRGKEGKVEEMMKGAKVVLVKRWGIKVLCVPFERRSGKVYYLACTGYKLPSERVKKRYLKRTGIEVLIRVLKQEMGIGKRLVRSEEGMKGWVAMCMVGYLLCLGREGQYRRRRDEVCREIEVYLSNPALLKDGLKTQDFPSFSAHAKL